MNEKLFYVGALGAVFMLAPFAIDMYLPALPIMASDLHTGIDELEATVAILLFGYAVGQLVLGPVSDRLGRTPVLYAGLVLFALASLLAAAATSVEQLYLWRFLQALGGAASVVVFPMVRDRFGETGSGPVISYIMALTVVAPLIAPIIGGYVLILLGWPAIFVLLAVLAVMTLVATRLLIKPNPTETQNRSGQRPAILASYRRVISNWRIIAHILAGSFAFAGLFAFVAGSPFVYMTWFGVAPENYGFLVALNAAAMIAVNLVNARLLAATDPTAKTVAGAALLALAGSLLLGFALLGLGLAWIVAGVVVFVGALGFTATNAIVGALAYLPDENGTVSALNGALQFSIGAAASFAVSLAASTSVLPMIGTMFAAAILALVAALPLFIQHLSAKEPANA